MSNPQSAFVKLTNTHKDNTLSWPWDGREYSFKPGQSDVVPADVGHHLQGHLGKFGLKLEPVDLKAEHEAAKKAAQRTCDFPACGFVGTAEEVLNHVMTKHVPKAG